MRVSVIISTYNRAVSLRETLRALRHQTYRDFEVLVVAGPCTDTTDHVLAEFDGGIRALHCPAVNLSISRNIGIAASAGDLCAFIDDDSLADPYWLEQLVQGFDRASTVGVGGWVYDPTGFRLQESPAVVDRRGLPVWDAQPPYVGANLPGSDQFLHLLGTNCCFRRDTLQQLGGFDEEYEYFLDETDMCLRAIDAGGQLRRLSRAVVHHKFRASHLRNEQKIIRHPYPIIKNSYYFALKAARQDDSTDAILTRIRTHVVEVLIDNARNLHRDGRLTNAELSIFLREVDQGMRDGLQRGLNAPRRLAPIPQPMREAFRPFPTIRPQGQRRLICITSQDHPREQAGGIGRSAWDLATALAAEGHEVHFLSRTPDHDRVDFDDGVWVHRLESPATGSWDVADLPPITRRNLAHAAAVHAEVRRIGSQRPIDAVIVPLWDAEGYFCLLDPALPTILTLQTSVHTMARLDPVWANLPEIESLLHLEKTCLRSARTIHGNTRATLSQSLADADRPIEGCDHFIMPYGMPDIAQGVQRQRGADGRLRVLFVGRLEHRKGIDLLLTAAVQLCEQHPHVDFDIVGDDRIPDAQGEPYRQRFEREHPELAGRVNFHGKRSDAELHQHYADCDLLCLPARYESFGLVLVEAMTFGKPVVAFATGGIVEVVRDGHDGLLAHSIDADSLQQRLDTLIRDDAQRHRLGEQARRSFEERFSMQRMALGMLEAIDERTPHAPDWPELPEWQGRRLRVAFVNSVLYQRDGISHAARLQMDLLRRIAHSNGINLDLRAFCLASDMDDPNIQTVASGDALAGHPFYRAADVIILNYGITSPIVDAIPFAPRGARVIVCYQGITRPSALPMDDQQLIHRSYNQMAQLLDADRFLASSTHTAEDLQRLGIETDRIGRLPPSAATIRADREPGSTTGPLRLLYLGRFVPAKGVRDLIEAAGALQQQTGRSVELELCGALRYSDEFYLTTLKQRIAELKLTVRFHTDASELLVQQLLRQVHALVMPSLHEGFCIPVLDALSHGCPVIASDAGALPETGRGLARHYPAGDVSALTARLADLDAARQQAMVRCEGVEFTWSVWLAACRERLQPYTESAYASVLAAEVFRTPCRVRCATTPDIPALEDLGRLTSRFAQPRAAVAPAPKGTPVSLAPASWSGRIRERLRKLPVVGPFCRYLKRLIYLPWNFHILFTQFQQQMQRERRNGSG